MLKINQHIHHSDRQASTQIPFDDARKTFYDSIEWALDISCARFKSFDVRGIPSRLFKRDPDSQVVVTRELALIPGWLERLSATNTYWPFMIKLFRSDGDEDLVLVAPLGAPRTKRAQLLKDLEELRKSGVTLPE